MPIRVVRRNDRLEVVEQRRPLEEVVWQESRPGGLGGRSRFRHDRATTAPSVTPPAHPAPRSTPTHPTVPTTPPASKTAEQQRVTSASQVPKGRFRHLHLVLSAALGLGIGLAVALLLVSRIGSEQGSPAVTGRRGVGISSPGAVTAVPFRKTTPMATPIPASVAPEVERRLVAIEEKLEALRADTAAEHRKGIASQFLRPTWRWWVEAPSLDRTATATVFLEGVSVTPDPAVIRATNLRTGQAVYAVLLPRAGRYRGSLPVIWEPHVSLPSALAVQPGDLVLLEWVTAPAPAVPHLATVVAGPRDHDRIFRMRR